MVAGEDACVDQFEFLLFAAAAAVFIAQLLIRKTLLRVAIERFGVAAGWCSGQVIHRVFDVFPVVAFGIAQSEQAFFQDRVLAIPERRRETKQAMFVRQTEKTVLSPAVAA